MLWFRIRVVKLVLLLNPKALINLTYTRYLEDVVLVPYPKTYNIYTSHSHGDKTIKCKLFRKKSRIHVSLHTPDTIQFLLDKTVLYR